MSDNVPSRPDLEGKLAFTCGDHIWLYRLRTGEIRRLLSGASDARWAPDGNSIAFVRPDGLYLADAEGAGERRVYAAENVSAPVWAPDGAKIAFERGDSGDPATVGEVWVYELESEATRRVVAGADPAWAPDSQRIAYVTSLVGQEPRRNELRLVNWLGQNDWAVVTSIPPNTPPIGVPGSQVERARLDHIMQSPFWDAAGRYLYAPSFVIYQALSDFSIWERADAQNGGSTFIEELPAVVDATPHPDREVALFSVTSARGDSWFIARPIEGGQTEDWRWAEASPGAMSTAPTWAPNGQAVAYYRCELDAPTQCTLRLLSPEGEEELIDGVLGSGMADPSAAPALDWGRDG